MASLKEILKDAAISAFVPGSIAYNCAKRMVEFNKVRDIRTGRRTSFETTIGDMCHGGIAAICTGTADLFVYSFYGTSFAAATGISILGLGEKFVENPNYAVAAGIGLVVAGGRAGTNILSGRLHSRLINYIVSRSEPYVFSSKNFV